MADLADLRARMTAVQVAALEAALATETDLENWEAALAGMNRQTTLRTLAVHLSQHGSGSVAPVIGDDLAAAIQTGAQASAASILETYNLSLARAILAFGELYEDATLEDYRRWLLGETPAAVAPGQPNWASQRGLWKVPQISMTETAVTVNLAVELFYEMNPELDGTAELVPYDAACPICQAGVNANPYESIGAAEAAGPWPAHIQCIHYPVLRAPRMAVDSSDVWRGE